MFHLGKMDAKLAIKMWECRKIAGKNDPWKGHHFHVNHYINIWSETHLPLDKMAIIRRRYFQMFCILTKISLKFVPKDPIDNNPALF